MTQGVVMQPKQGNLLVAVGVSLLFWFVTFAAVYIVRYTR